ncbi:MAG: glycosyltransferase [Saprospiraceae bacterium]|nr:glycosyltransferase [Saprospiraceae bacterium]
MTRLLFIYPVNAGMSMPFRYAETARRLYNEKVDIRLLTVGERIPLPPLLQTIPHQHIPVEGKQRISYKALHLQVQIWNYLIAIPKNGLSIFLNGLEFPVVFWACRKLNVPLTAQFPEEQPYSILHRRLIRWVGRSTKTTLLYGSQLQADHYHLKGFEQKVISMPLSEHNLKAAQQHREMSQPRGDAWFSVIIGCRSASADSLKKISLIADRCEHIRFQCWFFNKADLQRGSTALAANANVSCLRPQDGIPLYRTAKLYIEVEEPKGLTKEGLKLDYIREAMEFGLPALLLKNGIGREWITQGVNGYVLESGQIDEMANKIQLLAHSNLLYDRLSYNAVKVAQQWHPPKVCQALSNLFLAGKKKCSFRTGLRQSENLTT